MERAIVEMPLGTRYKYEVDKRTGLLVLDRPIDCEVPYNYGYIPGTLSEDGDPLDVFILSNEPIPPLTEVKIIPWDVIHCIDKDVNDEKIIGLISGDNIDDFYMFEVEIERYLAKYKSGIRVDYQKETGSFGAEQIIEEAKDRYLMSLTK